MPKTPKADVKHPEIKVLCKRGDKAMTFDEAKKYLGWTEDTPEEKFTDFDMELPNGRRVLFENNTRNRIWRPLQLRVLKQDHLNKRFRFNPDGFGIGTTGQIISCQHRLRSFCEAELERQADEAKWGTEPLTMECIVVVGMDESDETFRILNLTSPATAADAFYRQRLFPKQTKQNRAKLCTALEAAIKCLWVRTGENKDGYAPIQTNPEVVDFYERHPKLADFVLHVFEEYASGKGHTQRMGLGSMSALLYLMGCSATPDRVKYDKKRCDKSLDWSLEDKAADFVTFLCKGEGEFGIVRDILDSLCSDDNPISGLYERKAVLAKAWNLYRGNEAITKDGIKPSELHPDFGGIDLNEGLGQVESEAGDPPAPEPEEIAEAASEIVESKEEQPVASTPPTKDEKEKALITRLRVEHRNKILLFTVKKQIIVWEEDADLFQRLMGFTPKIFPNGMKYTAIPSKNKDDLLKKLKGAKKKSVFVVMDKDGETPICTDPETGNVIAS